MSKIEVYERLCYYDERNPNNGLEFIDKDDIPKKGNCHCDNCFYGRDKLANYIIQLWKEHNISN